MLCELLYLLLLLVPCMYNASRIISFQARRSRTYANSPTTFGLWLNVFLSTSLIVSRKAILCRPLDMLPSILPYSSKLSIFSVRIMWPRKWNCIFLIVDKSSFLALHIVSSFVIRSMYEIVISLRKNHISVPSILLVSSAVIVQCPCL